MPWCPQCKKEYPITTTFCLDCVTDLVDVLPDTDEYIPFFQGDKRSIAEKLAKYFEYSGLESKIHYDLENDVYILSVPASKEKEAKKHYQAFYFVERERIEKEEKNRASIEDYDESKLYPETTSEEAFENLAKDEIASTDMDELEAASYSDQDDTLSMDQTTETNDLSKDDAYSIELQDAIDEEDTTASLLTESKRYVFKSEKYKDYASSFSVFLIMGIAGIIFVLLNITEVLTILNGLYPNMIMGALFLFFIYVAITTGIKAKQLRYEAEEENQLTAKINQWLSNTVTKDFLSSITNKDLSEELDYIKKTETIRDMLIAEFGEQNQDYLDRLIEEFYNERFDSNEADSKNNYN